MAAQIPRPSPLATRAVILLAGALVVGTAHGQAPSASGSASVVIPTEVPLPEIPKLPDTDVGAPDADKVQDVRARIDQLLQTHADDPLEEVDFEFLLADLEPSHVPAIAARIQELRAQIDGKGATRRLEKARKAGRRALRKINKNERPEGDWLVFLLAGGDSESDGHKDSVNLYGMLRMLERIAKDHGDVHAVRQMIASIAYFGELVRIDVQRAILRLEDKAVPALLEAKKHDAKKVQKFARKHLDMLGRAIPGESVSTTDPVVLTGVLHAFGRIQDIEATRVVLSYTNADRRQIRNAARAAIGALGEPATWHIKDTYKNLTGNKPPRSWDHTRTAREIFRIHDRVRLTAVFERWDQGKKALDAKKYADAVKAFDGVLARMPSFDKRAEMAPAYLARAEELRAGDAAAALLLYRKTLRLTPTDADKKTAEARIALLEAKQLLEKGTPDRFLLERAAELDPNDNEANELLASLQQEAEVRTEKRKKQVGGIIAGVLALAVAILVLRRRDPEDESAKPPPQAPPPAPPEDPSPELSSDTPA